MLAIGDVCGKGADAAVVTALVRSTMRAAVARWQSPAAALRAVNTTLLQHDTNRFCTAALLRLRRAAGAWTPPSAPQATRVPLRISTSEPAAMVGRPGSLLGVLAEPEFTDVESVLDAGAMLLFYTDDVTEGRRDGAYFGRSGSPR